MSSCLIVAYLRSQTRHALIVFKVIARRKCLIDGQHYNGEHGSPNLHIGKASILFYQHPIDDSAKLVYEIRLDATFLIWMSFFRTGSLIQTYYSRQKQKQPQLQVEKLQRRRSGRREKSRIRPNTLSLLTRSPTTVSSKKSPLSNSSAKVFSLNVLKSVVAWPVSLSVTSRRKDLSSGSYIILLSSSTVSFSNSRPVLL